MFLVWLTYVELYNNKFRNLLEGTEAARGLPSSAIPGVSPASCPVPHYAQPPAGHHHQQQQAPAMRGAAHKIEVRESPMAGVFLCGPRLRYSVTSEHEALDLIAAGTHTTHSQGPSRGTEPDPGPCCLVVGMRGQGPGSVQWGRRPATPTPPAATPYSPSTSRAGTRTSPPSPWSALPSAVVVSACAVGAGWWWGASRRSAWASCTSSTWQAVNGTDHMPPQHRTNQL